LSFLKLMQEDWAAQDLVKFAKGKAA